MFLYKYQCIEYPRGAIWMLNCGGINAAARKTLDCLCRHPPFPVVYSVDKGKGTSPLLFSVKASA